MSARKKTAEGERRECAACRGRGDVKLQLTHEHERWIARTVVFGVCFVVAVFFGTCAANRRSTDAVEKARIEHGTCVPIQPK